MQDDYECSPSLVVDVESQVDSIKSELEQIRDDVQGKIDNMPQGTTESMEERVNAVEEAINTIEALDLSYDGDHEPDEEQQWCDGIWQDVISALDLSCS